MNKFINQKSILLLSAILMSLPLAAKDLGFRYSKGKCVNDGKEGLNPGYIGQCGDFRHVTASGFSFDGTDLSGTRFDDADLQGSTFSDSDLTGTNFSGGNLSGVDLTGAVLHSANFSKCTLINTHFAKADFQDVDLTGADLTGALLSFVKFPGSKFSGARFNGAVMDHADLSGTDLSAAIFSKADLTGANLTKASADKANFQSATMTAIDLTSAKLTSADLRAANLKSAKTTGADFHGAKFDKRTILPFSADDAVQLGMVLGKSPSIYIFWDSSPDDAELADLIKFFKQESVEVTLAPAFAYNMVGPVDLSDVTTVLHLSGGNVYNNDLPVSLQTQFVDFVKNGGTYVGTELMSYMVYENGYLRSMTDLTLMDYGNLVYQTPIAITPVADKLVHPLLEGMNGSFNYTGYFGQGKMHAYDTQPAVTLMTDATGSPTLLARDLGKGHAAYLALAVTYQAPTIKMPEVRKIFLNAINWN